MHRFDAAKYNHDTESENGIKKIREQLKNLLPDPKHPWRDPLKNSPFKWYEMVDIYDISDSESEGQ
jgi:hypothetical protein